MPQSNRAMPAAVPQADSFSGTWVRARGCPWKLRARTTGHSRFVRVQDLRATRAFYEQRRFSQTYQFPSDGEPGFVTMERGNSRIGIGAGGDGEEDTLRMWVYVDDVDGVAGLHTSGAPIVASPKTSRGASESLEPEIPAETWSTWALPLTSSFGSALATRGAGAQAPQGFPSAGASFGTSRARSPLRPPPSGMGCRCCSKARRRPLETVETVCSAQTVPDRGRPAEETESRPLTPAVLPAIAPDRTAALLRVADQGGSDVERSENLHATLEHTAMIAERTVAESHRLAGRLLAGSLVPGSDGIRGRAGVWLAGGAAARTPAAARCCMRRRPHRPASSGR